MNYILPLFSIVIPTYNREKLLRLCLEAILLLVWQFANAFGFVWQVLVGFFNANKLLILQEYIDESTD